MTTREALLGAALGALLAVGLVRPLRFSPVVRDSSEASWMAGASGPLLVAYAEPVALERERFDPVLAAAADALTPERFFGFGAYLTLGTAAGLFFLWLLLRDGGLPPAWAASVMALSAVPLAVILRLGHPLWLPSPWLVGLLWVLGRLARRPSAGSLGAVLLALGLLRAGSDLWFTLGFAVVVGFAAVAGSGGESRRAWPALLPAVGFAALLWFWRGDPAAPIDADTLLEAPVIFTARDLITALGPVEIALLAVLALPAVAALADGAGRRGLFLAGFLAWGSFSWRPPHHLRFLPPLRLWHWIPQGGEHAVPLVLAVAAAPLVFAASARWLARTLPPLAGWMLTTAAVAIVWRTPPPAPHPGRWLPVAPSSHAEGRVLLWPLDYDLLAERLALYPESSAVNLADPVLRGFHRFAPPAEGALWSEDFWRAVEVAKIDGLAPLPDERIEAPAGSVIAENAGVFRVDASAALARYTMLVDAPRQGWQASSSTGDALRFPPAAAFDGRPETRWATGGPQSPGQFFELDLGRELEGVTRIVLGMGGFETDLPQWLAVEVAAEGGPFRRVAVDARPHLGVAGVTIDFRPSSARRLRLVQLGRSRRLDWSIAEIAVLQQLPSSHSGPRAAAVSEPAANR